MRFPFGLTHCVVSCSQKLLQKLVGYAKRKWRPLSQALSLFLTLFKLSSIKLFSSFEQPLEQPVLGVTKREQMANKGKLFPAIHITNHSLSVL